MNETSTRLADHTSRVIAVATPKGGVGRTTLAVNLAAMLSGALCQTDRRVALVDCSLKQADIGKVLGMTSPSIDDFASLHHNKAPEDLHNYLAHLPAVNLQVLLGPEFAGPDSHLSLTPELLRSCIDRLRGDYDYIFLDCPVAQPHNPLFQNLVLREADYLLVPVTQCHTTLLNTHTWLTHVTQPMQAGGDGFQPANVGVVLNQEHSTSITSRDVRKSLSEWRYLGEIPYSDDWLRSVNRQELVVVQEHPALNTALARVLHSVTGEDSLRRIRSSTLDICGGKLEPADGENHV